MALTTVSNDQLRRTVNMARLIPAVRAALLDDADGLFDCPLRAAFDDGAALVMPVFHRPSRTTAVKILSLVAGRVPTIIGSCVFTSRESSDVLVADAGVATTLRTGAVVGVATDLMARADASRLVVFGAGAQAQDQVLAVCAVRPITTVTIVTRSGERVAQLIERLREELPNVEFEATAEYREVLLKADIVNCATPSSSPLFELDELPERVHVNAIGAYTPAMRELPWQLIVDAGVAIVDDVDAAIAESGELIDALDSGSFEAASVVSLATAIRSPQPLRDRTVFKSVGSGVQDWVVMSLLSESGADV